MTAHLFKIILITIFPLLGGGIYALGFPSTFAPTIFLGPTIGFTFFLMAINPFQKKVSLIKQLSALFFFALGLCLLGYYWIPYTMQVFGDINPPFNHILGAMFALILFPHYLIFILLTRLVDKYKNHFFKISISLSQRNLLWATILTMLEYYTPQEFPAHIGHSWLVLAPYLGLAPVFGAPVFSLIGFWLTLSFISFCLEKRMDWWSIVFIPFILIYNFAFPLKYPANINDLEAKTNRLRLVQANVGNLLKLDSEKGYDNAIEEVSNSYKDLSLAPSKEPLDLIIWPETAYPTLLNSKKMMEMPDRYIPPIFHDITQITNAELFIGGYDSIDSSYYGNFERDYNTAFFFSTNGHIKDIYHKISLIPFGETLPFGRFNKFFSKYIQNISYFKKGNRRPLFKTKNDSYFISAICYEILFSSFIASYLNYVPVQPHFLINLTNDSWYGLTSEPYQHLFLGKWRAVEFQLPIVRMTNTGITSILYPDGNESKRLELFKKDILDITLTTPTRRKTIFQIVGMSGILGMAIIILLIMQLCRKRKS